MGGTSLLPPPSEPELVETGMTFVAPELPALAPVAG
jgi:hypothetical protein